ncbi:MAG: glycosyltransferase [Imperialibacter sp.]|uniref:glycosyltransferase n=1 Tax=Imperialibacter sp. TaxID=2038411 RepID=UPI0030DC73E8|tara:strand:+ start:10733 stop:11851 length:1119 start_codon:yes stop_codon:yes gene_type:complete
MKIAIIGSRGYPYVYSGYETLVKELSERLVNRGVSVTVYCHKALFLERPTEVNGIKLVYLPSIETKILSQFVHSFLSVIHACFTDVDVIFAVNSANGPFGIITKLFRKKTAINVDGMEWLRPKWKGLGSRYFYFASWLATKLYDQIVNDSEEMRKTYLDLFNKDSVVIAYGANIRKSEQPGLIEKWGLTPNGYYLIVGRLIPDNNADLIVEGFHKTSSKRKLVIVGDVPYKDEYSLKIKAMADRDARLLFTGYVTNQNELAELYHNAFAYFHGHEFGGTNPTMLKAMAYGSCILALDTRFNREMLQDDKFGLFFSKNEDSIAALILDIESMPVESQRMKYASSKGITARYTWDHVAEQYIEVFNKLRPQRKK